jgi:hypothetical protein
MPDPVVDPAAPAVAPVAPAVDPAKPAVDPAAPAVDPAKPAVDPAKPAEPTADEKAATEAAAKAEAERIAKLTPEEKAAHEKELKDNAVPEKYEFVAPKDTTVDPEVATAFGDVAKELKLTSKQAQSVVDKLAPVMAARQAVTFAEHKESLLAAAKADKEIGGEKFDESVGIAKLAMDAYFTPEFSKFLNDTGLGNHPEMIRGLHKAGIPLKPDGWVPGQKGTKAPSTAQGFYNNSNMNA